MSKNFDFNRNPKGKNQHKLRSNKELQKIIDKYPLYTKKDFRGEGKLNPKKENALLTRNETDRSGLVFHQVGKRSNMKDILKHSTKESILEFEDGKIDLSVLRNRSSTIKWRNSMTTGEKSDYDKKIYRNLTKKQKDQKKERNKKYYRNLSDEQIKHRKNYDRIAAKKRWANITDEEWEIKKERDREFRRKKREEEKKKKYNR